MIGDYIDWCLQFTFGWLLVVLSLFGALYLAAALWALLFWRDK